MPKKRNWSEKSEAEFKNILKRYPDHRSCIMATLYLAQEEWGWISQDTMQWVAEKLEVPISQVWELVSFYTLYHRKAPGKFHLQVCRSLSCELNGSQDLLKLLRERYALNPDGISPDGMFSLTEVECLGSCGTAPVIQINQDYHENLDPDKLEELLKLFKTQAKS